MSARTPYLTSFAVVLGGLLLLAGYLALWIVVDTPQIHAQPAATAPAAWQTAQIPQLLSPAQYKPARDPAISKLIEQHNARQGQLATLSLAAQCTWNLDMPGKPRPMTITFDRTAGKASLACGDDRGQVDGPKITFSPKSAMTIDALYLLAFRKFNPEGFAPAPGIGEAAFPTVCAKSDTETLEFDARTGYLIVATFKFPAGDVALALSDYKKLPGDADQVLPATITVVVPAEMFPFERTRGGSIVLTIDPARSQAHKPVAAK